MKGQAFEVFRLLIAAVIGGAILMVLLGILQGIISPTTDPQTATAQLVKKNSKFGGIGTTDVITFRKDMYIDLRAVAREAYLDTECVKVGDVLEGFEKKDDKVIRYAGTGTRAKIMVECTESENKKCPIECTVSIIRP